MKAIVHTPRVLVEEWDIPGLLAQSSDTDVLAAVHGIAGTTARLVTCSIIDTNPPYVYSRSQDDLTEAGRRLAAVDAVRVKAAQHARSMAMDALDSGASERQVAASLNVDRSVIRAWRGK